MSRAERKTKRKLVREVRRSAVDVLIACPTGCGHQHREMYRVADFRALAEMQGEALPELPEGALVAFCPRCEHIVHAVPTGGAAVNAGAWARFVAFCRSFAEAFGPRRPS